MRRGQPSFKPEIHAAGVESPSRHRRFRSLARWRRSSGLKAGRPPRCDVPENPLSDARKFAGFRTRGSRLRIVARIGGFAGQRGGAQRSIEGSSPPTGHGRRLSVVESAASRSILSSAPRLTTGASSSKVTSSSAAQELTGDPGRAPLTVVRRAFSSASSRRRHSARLIIGRSVSGIVICSTGLCGSRAGGCCSICFTMRGASDSTGTWRLQ